MNKEGFNYSFDFVYDWTLVETVDRNPEPIESALMNK